MMHAFSARICATAAAICFALAFASIPAAAQADNSTSGSISSLGPDDLFELYQVHAGLGEGIYVRQFAQRAEALLERMGNTPGVSFDDINELAAAARYEREDMRRKQLEKQLRDSVQEMREELWRLCPPVTAIDYPNDDGKRGLVLWRMRPGATKYEIERSMLKRGSTLREPFERVSTAPAGIGCFVDDDLLPRREYVYRVTAISNTGEKTALGESPIVRATASWFNTNRGYFFAFVFVLCGTVLLFIQLARRGVPLKMREIAGLKAINDAVGRATEMGRPVLFVPGIQDMDQIGTVAGLNVLGRVALTTAEYGATLEVPTSKALVMVAARETVRAGYMAVGRPDAYDDRRIYYVTNEQMGYVSALLGYMVREKPAACIYMGAFYAESLLLAEVGNSIGSIQIAGTDETSQMPFFVAACDYTLLGEEFFAASAYLSGEAKQIGSLKGQDVCKLIVMLLVSAGVLLVTIQVTMQSEFTLVGDVLYFLTNRLLKAGD